ncbi:GATA zinc finger domain-containing protein [Trifolium repens]|nr:GATA zinc finger domain-containing protein [Trifolium repens]
MKETQQQERCLEEAIEVSVDTDFIKQFLEDEELNEVAVSGEVNKPNGVIVIDDEDNDDGDCIVLDCDPENQVKCVNDSSTGSDELCVVGEKGKIACRDYPHPRHHCANFPYSTTPHEKHCGQCHCYVCDSPAPCLKWGNGLLPTDHCHATDKLETWKTLRSDSKLVKTAPLPDSTKYGTSVGVVSSQNITVFPLPASVMVPRPGTITTTQLSSNSVPTNRVLRSTAARLLSANPIPQNQASQPITMNAQLQNELQIQQKHYQLLKLASRLPKSNPLSVNPIPQNQASQPISMNSLNQASVRNPLSVNLMSQNQASVRNSVPVNLMSQNQASVRNSVPVNLMSQNQASNQSTTNTLSSINSRLQDQISMLKNIRECATASNFTIPNGTTNGRYKKSGSTVARNKHPSNTVPTSLGIQNHAIQKKRGLRISSLGPQCRGCTMFNGIDSVGAGNTTTTNHITRPGASGISNLVNPQYDTRYRAAAAAAAAATGSSNSINCSGQDGVRIAKAINSLPTQPNYIPAPAYETQPCYQTNNSPNLYGYSNILGNDSLSCYVARVNQNRNLNEHQLGIQNGNAGGNIINSGTTLQDFLAKGSSWAENTNQNISNVENLVSKNMPSNANESSTPFLGNAQLSSLDDVKRFLLDSN